jgi:hypothetical protein
MTVCRRQLLQGSLSAGALLLATPSRLIAGASALAGDTAPASHSHGRPLLLLRSADDDAFALSAMQVARRHHVSPVAAIALSAGIVGAPDRLRSALAQYRGARLIGLMDDCTHTLLEEALRDLGGSILCLGRHRGLMSCTVGSRHSFTTTSATQGIGTVLARAVAADGTALLVQEHSLCGDEIMSRDGSAMQAGAWPAVLGASYALMAAGLWVAGPTVAEHRRGVATDHPRSEAFVSLVAEV